MIREDDAATTMVDSLVFLEGAHDGTARALAATYGLNIGDPLGAVVQSLTGFSDRPALYNLHPASDFLSWANLDPDLLPVLPTFNFYGDIGLIKETCDWFGLGDCHRQRLELGDVFLPTGTDRQFDTPLTGGAKYLRNEVNDGQSWQWSLTDDHIYRPFTFLDPPPLGWATNRPAQHVRLGKDDNMNDVLVIDCKTGLPVSLTSEMLSVIGGRMNNAPYACPDRPVG